MPNKLMGLARLCRPANLPTAAADILAGIAISCFFSGIASVDNFLVDTGTIILLVFSSVFLYAGGVVLNDVFDAKLDSVERAERPIPSGVVSIKEAAALGAILMLVGCTLASLVSDMSGYIAIILAAAIYIYDAIAKQHAFFGPLVMGICRGLNLLLGISVLGELPIVWIAIIPVLYIFAITLISRGEVHGDNKKHIVMAAIMYAFVLALIAAGVALHSTNLHIVTPFLLFFTVMIYRPLLKAYKQNSPEYIKKAVMGGVLSLVIMDACWAAGFSNWYIALGILLLLPISIMLSKLFAVT
jgi:4-hydroxybenzoate polyprenyltransferase